MLSIKTAVSSSALFHAMGSPNLASPSWFGRVLFHAGRGTAEDPGRGRGSSNRTISSTLYTCTLATNLGPSHISFQWS